MTTKHAVTLLPGDWIGPETTVAVQEIIAAPAEQCIVVATASHAVIP